MSGNGRRPTLPARNAADRERRKSARSQRCAAAHICAPQSIACAIAQLPASASRRRPRPTISASAAPAMIDREGGECWHNQCGRELGLLPSPLRGGVGGGGPRIQLVVWYPPPPPSPARGEGAHCRCGE